MASSAFIIASALNIPISSYSSLARYIFFASSTYKSNISKSPGSTSFMYLKMQNALLILTSSSREINSLALSMK